MLKSLRNFWTFDFWDDVWCGGNNWNNVNDTYRVQIFGRSFWSFASPPLVPALPNSLKLYGDWLVEYLISEMFSRNCARKRIFSQDQGRESVSTYREFRKQCPIRKKCMCRSSLEWRRQDVSTLHFHQELINFRHLKGRSFVLDSSIFQQCSLMLSLSRQFQVNHGTGYSRYWL